VTNVPPSPSLVVTNAVACSCRAAKGTKSGNPIGRPRVDAETESAIERLLRGGTGINKTAATVGVGTATLQRIRAAMGPFESAGTSAA